MNHICSSFKTNNILVNIHSINDDLFCFIFQYLSLTEVYTAIRYVCRNFNNLTNTFVHETAILQIYKKLYLFAKILLPKNIWIDQIEINDIVPIKHKFTNRNVKFRHCDFENKECLPKKLNELILFGCFNYTQSILDISTDKLWITTKTNFSEIEVKTILDIKTKKLGLNTFTLSGDIFTNVTNNNFNNLVNNVKLENLGLTNFTFEEPNESFDRIIGKCNLSSMHLTKCQITASQIEKLAYPCVLTELSLKWCKIDDEIMTNIFGKNNYAKLKEVDLCGSLITNDSFKYLNAMNLTTLTLNYCENITTFSGLNVPTLTELSIIGNSVNDDDIQNVFRMPLRIFQVGGKITTITLKRIRDSGLKIISLTLHSQYIGIEDVLEYLTGMNLKNLCGIKLYIGDEERLIEKNVIERRE
jgi:hypothetical protein